MSNHRPPGDDNPLMIAGVIIVLAVLGCYMALVLTGNTESTTELLTFVTPVVAALLIVRKVSAETQRQDLTLAKIERQTNGVLDARIREGVAASLEAAGLAKPHTEATHPTVREAEEDAERRVSTP